MLDAATLDHAPAAPATVAGEARADDPARGDMVAADARADAERLRRAAGCYGEMARSAACWAHPSWLAVPLGLTPEAAARLQQALAAGPREGAHAVSAALLRHCRVGPAPLPALFARGPRGAAASAALLCLVPPAPRLRMLCVRALLGHADELRRLVDRPARQRLAQAIGMPLAEFVSRAGGALQRAPTHAVAACGADALAAAGYAALVAERAPPGRFAALALPCDDVLAAPAAGAARARASLGAAWAALLPELFPEWSWLFG